VTQTPDPQKPKGSQSVFGDLINRSTGLPEHQTPKSEEKPEAADGSYNPWRIAGLGLQMAGTVGLMYWLGYSLDQYFGWGHNAAVTMTILAIVGSLYLMLKEALRLNK